MARRRRERTQRRTSHGRKAARPVSRLVPGTTGDEPQDYEAPEHRSEGPTWED